MSLKFDIKGKNLVRHQNIIFSISLAVLAIALISASSVAAETCSNAPRSKFQDRAKLDDILKPKCLMINKINEENGCYKVVAVTRQFKTVTLLFNAETLQPVSSAPGKKGAKNESAL